MDAKPTPTQATSLQPSALPGAIAKAAPGLIFIPTAIVMLLWLSGRFHSKINESVPGGRQAASLRPARDQPRASAELITVPRIETAVGSVQAVHEMSVASKILARVEKMNVNAGVTVNAGDIIAELDSEDLQARLAQATAAAAAAARTRRDQLSREFDRVKEVFASGAANQLEVNRAQSAFEAADSELQQAEQAQREAETILQYATIRAPMTGVVIEKLVETGDTVAPGQTMVTLYDPTRMQLVAGVRESLTQRLEIGNPVDVAIDAIGLQCTGTISEIVPESSQGSRSFLVKVTGPCPEGVYSGMFGRLLIPLDNETVLVIAAQAVRRVGQIDHGDQAIAVEVGEAFHSAAALLELVVGLFENRPVFLKDVATVVDGPAELTNYVRHGWGPARDFEHDESAPGARIGPPAFAGTTDDSHALSQSAVTIAVAKKKGINAVRVARETIEHANQLRRTIVPDDMELVITRNYGLTANDKVNELIEALGVAVFIVIALLTLGFAWREALIVAVAVPVVFGLTLLVNLLAGFTINRVTLFALILSLGLLVDDPIVDVENIVRHFRLRGRATRAIVHEAVTEIRPPLITATLAVIVSFLPMMFITGMMGPYMRPMALNVPVAMFMSMFVTSHHARLKVVETPPGPPVLSTLVAEVRGQPDSAYHDLIAAAETVRQRRLIEPGVVDVDDTIQAKQTKWRFVVDNEKAAINGVSVEDIARTVAMAIDGADVGTIRDPNDRQPVAIVLRLPRSSRSGADLLNELRLRGRGAATVPLAEIGRWEADVVDQTIYHKNLEPVVHVTAECAGRPPAEVLSDLHADRGVFEAPPRGAGHVGSGWVAGDEPRSVDDRSFIRRGGAVRWATPSGIDIFFIGEGEVKITLEVFRDLGAAFGVALIAIYIILVAQTSSFIIPAVVMLAIPLTVLGVMPGFWLLNAISGGTVGGYADPTFFTATGMIGMIALSGIVT